MTKPKIDLDKRWPNGATAIRVWHRGLKKSGYLYFNDDGTYCFRQDNGRKHIVYKLDYVREV